MTIKIYAMTKDFRSVLSPLLIVNYVCGLRIIEFPAGHPRLYFSLLYILLSWSIYYFLFQYTIIYSFKYNLGYTICLWTDFFTILLSVAFAVYHNKKFRNCMKKLSLVDDTLGKLGIKTDYYKLRRRMIWFVVVSFVISTLLTYVEVRHFREKYNFGIPRALYTSHMTNYFSHANFFSNMTFTTILGYIAIKFDQVNEYLRDLVKDNKCGIKQAWKNLILHSPQRKFPKTTSNKWMAWFVIHLHAELRKICREIDSIFGIEMTISMASYFGWLGYLLQQILYTILVNNYAISNKYVYICIVLAWSFHHTFKILLINYVCERVSAKANATGDLINRMSCYTYDVEIRENISQLLLQMTQSPVRFYGIGLFQFGFKILRGFCKYIVTVLVIIIQGYVNK